MSSPIIALPGAGRPSEDRPDVAAGAALDRLGMATARRRGRRDRKVTRTATRQLQACDRLAVAATGVERTAAAETVARRRADGLSQASAFA